MNLHESVISMHSLTPTRPHLFTPTHALSHPAQKDHTYPHTAKKGHTHPHPLKKWSHPPTPTQKNLPKSSYKFIEKKIFHYLLVD